MPHWLLWALGTVLCWGLYVVTLHQGQQALARDAFLAFAFVCLAYALVGFVDVGVVANREHPLAALTTKGALLATVAGALGAFGAFFLICALKSGGSPLVVAPLIFAGAPVVNTLASMALHPPKAAISPLFFVGCLLAAGGAYLVLAYRPV